MIHLTQNLTSLIIWLTYGLLVALAPSQSFSQSPEPGIEVTDSNTTVPDYSTYYEGVEAMDAGDMDRALAAFKQSAEDGVAIAQYNLGVLYFSGRGVPQDYREAYRWTRMAAEQGFANAQANLGTLYYNDLGVSEGIESYWPISLFLRESRLREAAHWYRAAAEQDHGQAQYFLATLYEAGSGVDRDLIQAYQWGKLALDNEVPEAIEFMAQIEAEITQAQKMAAESSYAEWVLEHRG
jgi:TPR repeat protein